MHGDIGRYVRRRREALGWSGQKLAEKLGKSQSYVSKVELGGVVDTKTAWAFVDAVAEPGGQATRVKDAVRLEEALRQFDELENKELAWFTIENAIRALSSFETAPAVCHVRLIDPPVYDFGSSGSSFVGALNMVLSARAVAADRGRLVVAVGERVKLPGGFDGAEVVKLPERAYRNWRGPVRMMLVGSDVVVGADDWGMQVTFDTDRVGAVLDLVRPHVENW